MQKGYRSKSNRNSCIMNIAILLLLLTALLPTEASSQSKASAAKPVDYALALKLLPAKATVTQTVSIDFENNGIESLAIVYQNPTSDYPPDAARRTTSGLMIMSYHVQKGWQFLHHEPASSGSPESILCDILKVKDNTNALFVQYVYSGAGFTADWGLYSIRKSKLLTFDRMPILEKVLKDRDYVFMGYNSASVTDDFYISESIAGYSKEAARCCSDRPALIVLYTFTGSSIDVVSVTVKEERDGTMEQTGSNNISREDVTPLSEEEALIFIADWLRLSEKNDTFDQVMRMYAEHVYLFKFGEVNKSLVAKDKNVYFKKWPTRKYRTENITIIPDKRADRSRVQLKYHFSLSNNKKTIKGTATSVLQLQKHNGIILITSEKGEVL